MNKPCSDCVMEYGHWHCTMNCGPAVDAKAHFGDNGITAADQAIRAASVVDNTPKEYQAAALKLASLDFEALRLAVYMAQLCHKGQFDKGGEPYIWHAMRVGVKLLPDIDAAVAGLLHDVLEDCPLVTEAELLYGAGGNQEILAVLKLLKKDKGEDYAGYIDRVATHPLARKVKMADLEDNLDPRRMALAASAGGAAGAVRVFTLEIKYKAALEYLRYDWELYA